MLHKNQKSKASAGFTIIEVLIVLAIAGLILLIVFLAVPALQRNSRNTAIKNDVQNTIGGIAEYSGANNGALPDTVAGTGTVTYSGTASGTNPTSIKIQGSTVVDSKKQAPPAVSGTGATVPDPGNVTVYLGYRCDGTKSARAVSAVFSIESAGGKVGQCTDS